MLLCIDIGNTNTVLATFDGDKLVHSWRIKTDARSTADELGLMFRGLLAGDAVEITGVAACSTVPAALRSLRTMLSRYYADLPNVIVEPGVRTGVQLAIDNPKEVGADRVVNTLAAYTLYGGPSIVVDFGTTTNFDVISGRGEFLGGAFAPGIEISFDALAARAAQLRKVEPTKPRSVIGKNTVECLQAGMYFGFAGQVDRIVERMTEELGEVRAVIATGGLAPLVIDECRTHHPPRADDHADRAADGLRAQPLTPAAVGPARARASAPPSAQHQRPVRQLDGCPGRPGRGGCPGVRPAPRSTAPLIVRGRR